jgi:phosphoglycerate kinase
MLKIKNYNFSGKKALIRVDFNVPLNKDLKVTDSTRILASLLTIKKVINDGGAAILMSHLGRPKNGYEEKYSLVHVVYDLSRLLGFTVKFADDCIGNEAKEMAENLQPGEVLLLENLRFYKEEEAGNRDFAKKLADLADVYVNDAFGTCHRAHASTSIVAEFFPDAKMFGYLIQKELININKALESQERPVTAIMGGSKVSDKIGVIENLLPRIDRLLIGGGMSYTFIKALGGKIGNSLLEADKMDTALEILEIAKKQRVEVYLPTDNVIADDFSNDANTQIVASNKIPNGFEGLDIGPKTIEQYAELIKTSRTIMWNGPVGVFEFENFSTGSRKLADAFVEATEKGAFTLVGGGDSAAAFTKFGLAEKVSFMSTGGGALLEYIEGKELPGLVAITG